jgi:uncharacterized membrane protein HdeD (DUF308 family)
MTLWGDTSPAGEGAAALLDQRRLSFALRSGASLLFACAFFWPTLTYPMMVKLFAVYAFVDGVLALAPGGWSLAQRAVWPLRCIGCVNIAAAAAAYLSPALVPFDFGDLLAVWAIALAAARTIGCATMREADPGCLLLLAGIAAGFFGRALLSPEAGDVVILSTWIGLYALTVGIVLFKLTMQRYRPMFVDLST